MRIQIVDQILSPMFVALVDDKYVSVVAPKCFEFDDKTCMYWKDFKPMADDLAWPN